jgi:hypothetical protein
MAIVQISRIQLRRGLNQDLPTLASAEMAWSVDTRQLYIGNGTMLEGAPTEGITEILTEYSILNFTNSVSGNVTILQQQVAQLQNEIGVPTVVTLPTSSSGTVTITSANNAIINYTLNQGTKQRTGEIRMSYYPSISTVTYDEEYNETATTDLVFTMNANTTQANLNYTTTTATQLLYTITTL